MNETFKIKLELAIERAAQTLINEMAEKQPDDEWRKNLEALIKVKRSFGNDDKPEKIDGNDAMNRLLAEIEGVSKNLTE